MSHFIETEINGADCAFYVKVILSDGSFGHAFGTEHRIDVEFEIEDCEGCTVRQAQNWCELPHNASRLIEREIKEIESDRLESKLARLE